MDNHDSGKDLQRLKIIATIPNDAVVALKERLEQSIKEARLGMDEADTMDTFRKYQGAIAALKDVIGLITTARDVYEMLKKD